MTAEEVKKIVLDVLDEVGISISSLVKIKGRMKTKEVCEYLKCDRKWLYRNKERFAGRRINRRNDYDFETSKVVEYKLKNFKS